MGKRWLLPGALGVLGLAAVLSLSNMYFLDRAETPASSIPDSVAYTPEIEASSPSSRTEPQSVSSKEEPDMSQIEKPQFRCQESSLFSIPVEGVEHAYFVGNLVYIKDKYGESAGKLYTMDGTVVNSATNVPAQAPSGKMWSEIVPTNEAYFNRLDGFAATDWLVNIYNTDNTLRYQYRFPYFFLDNGEQYYFTDQFGVKTRLDNRLTKCYWIDDETLIIEGAAIWSLQIETGEIKQLGVPIAKTIKEQIETRPPELFSAKVVGWFDDGFVYSVHNQFQCYQVFAYSFTGDYYELSDSSESGFVFDNYWYLSGMPDRYNLLTHQPEDKNGSAVRLGNYLIINDYNGSEEYDWTILKEWAEQIRPVIVPKVVKGTAPFYSTQVDDLFVNPQYLIYGDYLLDLEKASWHQISGNKNEKLGFIYDVIDLPMHKIILSFESGPSRGKNEKMLITERKYAIE